MNSTIEEIHEQIDRLVDGELPEVQRSQLFTAVEEQPDGWKYCTLAYVEAQTLTESFADDKLASQEAVAMPRWARWGGLAAALVAAFAAGKLVDPPSASASEVVAESESFAPEPEPIRHQPRPALFEPVVVFGGAPAYTTHESLPEFMLQALVAAGHRVRQTERNLRLDVPDGAEIDLPIIETQIVDMRPQTL